jgi:hypothetical protein
MSAYIVDTKTIDRVVTAAIRNNHKRNGKAVLCYGGEEYDPTKLGQLLFKLNCAAVDHRYQEENPIPMYSFTEQYIANDVQLYKAITCFLYQCSEGEVWKGEFYEEVETLKASLAHNIIAKTEEYENAAWA